MSPWKLPGLALAALLAAAFFSARCGMGGDVSGTVKVDTAVDTRGRIPLDPSKPVDTLKLATLNMAVGFPVTQLLFTDMTDPVVAFNTLTKLYAEYLKNLPGERVKAMGKVIAEESPDVVGLQEVMTLRKGDSLVNDFLAELLLAIEASGGPDYAVFHTVMNDTVLTGKKGDSTLSLDFREGQTLLVKPGYAWLDSARFRYKALLVVPSGSNPETDRGADYLRLRSPGGLEFQVFNSHLEVAIDNLGARQALELRRLADSLQIRVSGQGRLQVVMGDLNAGPDSLGHLILKNRGFADTFDGVNLDSGATCCVAGGALSDTAAAFSNGRIDYVLARGMTRSLLSRTNVKGLYTGTGGVRFQASDHRMVVAHIIAQSP